MAYNVIFIDGTLDVIIPPCTTVTHGSVTFFTGKKYTLPANCDGVLSINLFTGDVQVYEDMFTPLGGVQHPDYFLLEYVNTRQGVLIRHAPLTGPLPQSGVLTSQVWGMVSLTQLNPFTVGGPNGLRNYYNGHNFNMAGASLLDVTLAKEAAPGFQCRFLSTTASGFRLITDSSAPIVAKASLTITGIGSTASAIVFNSEANGDAKWFVTST